MMGDGPQASYVGQSRLESAAPHTVPLNDELGTLISVFLTVGI